MTFHMDTNDPLAVAVVQAIQSGDVAALTRLLAEHPGLATAMIDNDRCQQSRTLVHVATDWPGHFRNGAATVSALVNAGADVNAGFVGAHNETPLHWAASSNDVPVLDALIDAGADIEAVGGVILRREDKIELPRSARAVCFPCTKRRHVLAVPR